MRSFFQNERGSVMMEFIIVFPIYLVLFAAVMAIGDTLVHSIRLPSADRVAAFDVGAAEAVAKGWPRVSDTLFPPREVSDDGDRQDSLVFEQRLDHSADVLIEGPWAMTAGAKVRDDYKLLAGGAAGQLAFCDWFFSDVTKTSREDGLFGDLMANRPVAMYSKAVNSACNYITLKRRRDMDGLSWRDNGRNASDLVVHDGWRKVVEEKRDDGSARESNRGELGRNPQSFEPEGYARYPQFVIWSN